LTINLAIVLYMLVLRVQAAKSRGRQAA
jgi:hypothetical protein